MTSIPLAVSIHHRDRAFIEREGDLAAIRRPVRASGVAIDVGELAKVLPVRSNGEDLDAVVRLGLERDEAVPVRGGGADARSEGEGQ